MTRFLSLVLALLVAAVAAAAPTDAPAAPDRCKGQQVARGAQAVVFSVRIDDGSQLRACLRADGRPMILAGGDVSREGSSIWRNPVVAGRYVAYERLVDEKCPSLVVEIVDLRRRRVVSQVAAGSSTYVSDVHGCQGGGSPTTALVLRSDGLAAFVVEREDVTHEVVRSAGRDRMVRLARDEELEPGFLRVTRTEVQWFSGGEVRRAPVPRLR